MSEEEDKELVRKTLEGVDETLDKSKAKVKDAIDLLTRTLRKCRIRHTDVIIVIPDPEARKKLGNPDWGFGENLKMLTNGYNQINQFILRYHGVTILGPEKNTD